ncbi:carbohydrate ABC transporter permease [Streptobacillus moniliformis]|uniref:Binding-protein-dependent transport systems inner membrane component n=1 Tax=Streptobacillus moniliformis (strain ATCC 14647 / DSM 12112 / NCTC 10651 / 9901) TaxID=519441 RepID=D1AUU7_STRM9|nr:carbohydrate ABC transporter permease [Streptobacillus moniliformis]ACZ01507.1 binding-protein-dependent transport systems inner membrane component [Streptobacillus moniliformis DSM 12112]AVL43493.1 carbohydrate ABC transporter permease [Streptobacillus moniliformis]SQA13329.1 Inner membrane ABC transporter permease protein ycjP [Streptobacillus moniliformis]
MEVKKTTPLGVISMIILIIFALFFIFPFYWILTGSFKIQDVAISIPPQWIPVSPTLENYDKLLVSNTARWFFNSVFVSSMTTILVCVTATLAGYALAKKDFPGVNILFIVFVAAMALPKQVILIPLLKFMTELGWIDTYKALILPAVGWPFGVFLMKQFSHSVPNELLESAKIDGCGEFRTFLSIVLPIVKPGIGALAIFTFILSWNDYFSQLIFTNSELMKTLPLGVASMSQQAEFSLNYGLLMAGAALASLPMIVVFLMFQSYFTQGVTMGAVKG